jgi:hypothetical protein
MERLNKTNTIRKKNTIILNNENPVINTFEKYENKNQIKDEKIVVQRIPLNRKSHSLNPYNVISSEKNLIEIQQSRETHTKGSVFLKTEKKKLTQKIILKANIEMLHQDEKNDAKKNITENQNDYSLFIFPQQGKLRQILTQIINNKIFLLTMIFFIFLNSIFMTIALSLDLYLDDKSDFFSLSEYFFTALFTLESIVKIISYGFILGENTYLRDMWNVLDFIIVVFSILSLIPGIDNLNNLKGFRLLRPLKSLPFISNMKIMISVMGDTFSKLVNILLFLFTFVSFFSILSVSLWSKIYDNRCRITEIPTRGIWDITENYISLCGGYNKCGEKYTCGSWNDLDKTGFFFKSPFVSINKERLIGELNYGLTTFENFVDSAQVILQVSTLEGWTEIMYLVQNSYSYVFGAIYFIIMIIILNYFVLNFTIGLMMNNFQKIFTEMSSEESKLKEQQYVKLEIEVEKFHIRESQSSLNIHKIKDFLQSIRFFNFDLKYPSEYTEKNKIASVCYQIYNQPIFNYIMDLFIIINTVVMTLDSDMISQNVVTIANSINFILVIFFTIEFVLKLIGLGFRLFFANKFNIFDMLIVIFSITEICLAKNNSTATALRTFRIMRIIKLLKSWETLNIIIKCIELTVLDIGNYVILLILCIYIFSLLGMNFFKGKLYFNSFNEYDKIRGEIPRLNFENILTASLTIFTILIGSGWPDIFFHCILSEDIDKYQTYFFFMITKGGLSVLVNLVISFLIYNFEKSRRIVLLDLYLERMREEKKSKLYLI